jgi:hypothetical protein
MSSPIDTRRLPAHARLVACDDVWMDGEGLVGAVFAFAARITVKR